MTLATEVHAPDLRIEGDVDLPDNAIIEWEVLDKASSASAGQGSDIFAEEGQTIVKDGKYSTLVKLNAWPTCVLTV